MAEQLSVGDIVRLKSGGPLMTIQGFFVTRGTRLAKCSWFVNDDAKSDNFAPESLIKQD